MALAKIKLPKKSSIMGFANGVNASFTVVILSIVKKMGIKRAVTGIGIHSVTHHTTTRRNTANRSWALGFSESMGAK